MQSNKTKKPTGIFSFRVTEDERQELKILIEKAKVRLNKNSAPDDYSISKSQIIIEAIRVGLKSLK